jgi:hypothetical protein
MKRFTLSGLIESKPGLVLIRTSDWTRSGLDALRRAQRDVARDAPAHGKPDQVQLRRPEVLDHAQHVAGEVLEVQRAVVVVGLAVAARVPGHGPVAAREELELAGPVAAVAADAVEKQHQLTLAGDRKRQARRGFDENRVQGLFSLRSRDFYCTTSIFVVLL